MTQQDSHQLLWMDDGAEEETPQEASLKQQVQSATASAVSHDQMQALENDLQRTTRELADVRKELAAKVTIDLPVEAPT